MGALSHVPLEFLQVYEAEVGPTALATGKIRVE